MSVRSPIAGRVTARSAQVGLLTQPGVAPAPITVADMRTLWMVAGVPESELGLYKLGQSVNVHVQAYAGKAFNGKVSYIGDAVDPNSRRIVVRADIHDPEHLLRPQMLADFSFVLSAPAHGLSVPATAVVRESDGSTVVWKVVGSDKQGTRLVRQKVETGESEGTDVRILSGLPAGVAIARKNALFLSNLYATDVDD